MSLTATIKTIQDIMRKDVGVDGDAQRIGQLVWLLFLKILDAREQEWELDNDYVSPLPNNCRWHRWAAPEDETTRLTGDKLMEFINNTLFPTLKDVNALGQPEVHISPLPPKYRWRHWVAPGNDKAWLSGDKLKTFAKGTLFPALDTQNKIKDQKTQEKHKKIKQVIFGVFMDAYNYMKNGTLLRQVVNKIEEIPFESQSDRHKLGDIYEKILRDLQAAGNAGEFYTPRAVTQFVIDRLAPQLGERILDPSCGTGGFLADSINYLNPAALNTVEQRRQLQNAIHGYEVKALPHMLAVTNMILHGIDAPVNIKHQDTLNQFKQWKDADKYDIIATNPPFGGVVADGLESDFPTEFRTKETADLFLYFIITKMLAKGGRCAVVLPDGFLFGEGMKNRLKEKLMAECNLHTIVRLPYGVFNPYTGIKTNILFFRKGKPTETVWFYEHPYPEGYKNYSKTRPMRFEEFEAEQAWWGDEADDFAARVENDHAWKFDFKTRKEDAETKAQPHYDRQIKLEAQAQDLNLRIKSLNQANKERREQLKNTAKKAEIAGLKQAIEQTESEITGLREHVTKLTRQASDEKAAGDRIKYAVYNLDQKNPRSVAEEILDPDELLAEYHSLKAEVAKFQQALKEELAAALLHT